MISVVLSKGFDGGEKRMDALVSCCGSDRRG
jgi:hypothetical protein